MDELNQMSEVLWKEYQDEVQELLKKHQWVSDLIKGGGGSQTGFIPSDRLSSMTFKLNPSIKVLKGTPYYIEPKDKRFVHFTSFQAFKEIINSGKIRLYNPHYGNDPNEVIFASKSRFEKEHEKDSVLNSLFVLSMNEEKAKEDLNMWKLYGGDGHGVGLVFEFENSVNSWHYWYFGKVLYEEKGMLSKLNKFHKELNELQEQFGEGPKIDIDISPIYAFQKAGLFRAENEVRLMHFSKSYYGKHDTSLSKSDHGLEIRKTLNNNYKECYYLEYPIYWKDSDKDLENSIGFKNGPRIRLKEVILGYRHNESEIEKIKMWWYKNLKDNFWLDHAGRNVRMVDFSISSLKEYFR